MPTQSKRFKVLLSAFACEPGRGSEQEVGWRWALELSRRLDVTILTQTRNRPGIERAVASGICGNRTIHFEYLQLPKSIYTLKSRFNCLTWPYYAIWQWVAMRKVRDFHRETPFQVIHHLTFASFRVPIWMKYVGPPVIMGPVGGAEQAPWNLLQFRSSAISWLIEALRNIMTSFSVMLMRKFPPIEDANGLCLAATPAMFDIFHRQGLPCILFPTIGIEGAPVQSKANTGEIPCRFLFVGRLHLLKGVQFLLEAFARGWLPGASLTLVGDGPEASRLKLQAEELGIGSRVMWLGAIPREKLSKIYEDHDVMIAPSMYESGGMVALEAMQHSLPCIVLDVGGHAVSVTPDCGFKIPATDSVECVIAGLMRAMEQYAEDPLLRCLHGEAALVRVTEEYKWERKTRRMLEIYDQVLKTRLSLSE